MKKFINKITFGWLCKPKKEYGLFLFINDIPVAMLERGLDESYYNNIVVKEACRKIADNYTVAANDFPEVDSLLNEMGIKVEGK